MTSIMAHRIGASFRCVGRVQRRGAPAFINSSSPMKLEAFQRRQNSGPLNPNSSPKPSGPSNSESTPPSRSPQSTQSTKASPVRAYYRSFGLPVLKVMLGALFTYEVLYWLWLKLESIEEESEKNEQLSGLKGKLVEAVKERTASK